MYVYVCFVFVCLCVWKDQLHNSAISKRDILLLPSSQFLINFEIPFRSYETVQIQIVKFLYKENCRNL